MLAVDTESNGFRSVFLPMAAADESCRNALYALSGSHLLKWSSDMKLNPSLYLAKALKGLQDNLEKSKNLNVTIATIGILIAFEVFNGSVDRWRQHLSGLAQLLRLRGSNIDINPFLKQYISFLDIQSALNVGQGLLCSTETLLNDASFDDPFFTVIDSQQGCSIRLLKTMVCVNGQIQTNMAGQSSAVVQSFQTCRLLPRISY